MQSKDTEIGLFCRFMLCMIAGWRTELCGSESKNSAYCSNFLMKNICQSTTVMDATQCPRFKI